MYHVLLEDVNFWLFLLFDRQGSRHDARRSGCPCGGRLHCANYLRNPRGGPDHLAKECCYRLSFCCGRNGCRKRVTPPSTRFLGPKVYLAAVILLAAANRQGPSPRAMRELSKLFGADRRTIGAGRSCGASTSPTAASGKSLAPPSCRRSRRPPFPGPSSKRSFAPTIPAKTGSGFCVSYRRSPSRKAWRSKSRDDAGPRAEDAPRPRGGSRLGWSGESPFHPIREEH